MHEWMPWLLAPALAHAGMVWLALAMPTHWQQVWQTTTEPSARAVLGLRALAALAMSLSLLACLWLDHPSMAVLVWVMWLSVAAVVVTFGLAWRPKMWRPWTGRFRSHAGGEQIDHPR